MRGLARGGAARTGGPATAPQVAAATDGLAQAAPAAPRPAAPRPAAPPPVALDLRDPERETSVARLFDTHHVKLVRLAALLGAGHEAEDVVAEAFCSLYRRWNRLRDAGAALGYLRACVVNETNMRLRHRQVVARNAAPEAAPRRSAEAEVLVREDQRHVLAALDALPARQREAIVLRYWMDLREAEVAEAMGVSTGTVKTHTSRAMAALTATLEEAW